MSVRVVAYLDVTNNIDTTLKLFDQVPLNTTELLINEQFNENSPISSDMLWRISEYKLPKFKQLKTLVIERLRNARISPLKKLFLVCDSITLKRLELHGTLNLKDWKEFIGLIQESKLQSLDISIITNPKVGLLALRQFNDMLRVNKNLSHISFQHDVIKGEHRQEKRALFSNIQSSTRRNWNSRENRRNTITGLLVPPKQEPPITSLFHNTFLFNPLCDTNVLFRIVFLYL